MTLLGSACLPVASQTDAPADPGAKLSAQMHKEANWYYQDGKRRERLGDVSGAAQDYRLALKLAPASGVCRQALDRMSSTNVGAKAQGFVRFAYQPVEPPATETGLFAMLNRALRGSSIDRSKADAAFVRVIGRNNIQIRWKFYPVRGADAGELWNSMQQTSSALTNSPDVGITKWDYQWKTVPEFDSHGREICSAALAAKITITMPRWKTPSGESPQLLARWREFYTGLLYHEQGHQLIAEFTLAALRLRIDANRSRAFPLPISDVCSQTMQDYASLNDQYDRATQHGALQGAVFQY